MHTPTSFESISQYKWENKWYGHYEIKYVGQQIKSPSRNEIQLNETYKIWNWKSTNKNYLKKKEFCKKKIYIYVYTETLKPIDPSDWKKHSFNLYFCWHSNSNLCKFQYWHRSIHSQTRRCVSTADFRIRIVFKLEPFRSH